MISAPVAFWILAWVFRTPAGKDGELFFADHMSRIECVSKATEIRERATPLKLTYSRLVCVPVPKEDSE